MIIINEITLVSKKELSKIKTGNDYQLSTIFSFLFLLFFSTILISIIFYDNINLLHIYIKFLKKSIANKITDETEDSELDEEEIKDIKNEKIHEIKSKHHMYFFLFIFYCLYSLFVLIYTIILLINKFIPARNLIHSKQSSLIDEKLIKTKLDIDLLNNYIALCNILDLNIYDTQSIIILSNTLQIIKTFSLINGSNSIDIKYIIEVIQQYEKFKSENEFLKKLLITLDSNKQDNILESKEVQLLIQEILKNQNNNHNNNYDNQYSNNYDNQYSNNYDNQYSNNYDNLNNQINNNNSKNLQQNNIKKNELNSQIDNMKQITDILNSIKY